MTQFLGISDIASKYEIPRYQVWNWIRRNERFPSPVQYINNGKNPIFDYEEVDKFIRAFVENDKKDS